MLWRALRSASYNTQIPGTVILTSDTPGPHEWKMRKDMVTITNLPATTYSHGV